MKDVINWLVLGLLALVFAALVICLLALPTMFIWNAVVPSIFGLKTITFVEALCLNALSSILFKSNMPSSSSKNNGI